VGQHAASHALNGWQSAIDACPNAHLQVRITCKGPDAPSSWPPGGLVGALFACEDVNGLVNRFSVQVLANCTLAHHHTALALVPPSITACSIGSSRLSILASSVTAIGKCRQSVTLWSVALPAPFHSQTVSLHLQLFVSGVSLWFTLQNLTSHSRTPRSISSSESETMISNATGAADADADRCRCQESTECIDARRNTPDIDFLCGRV
jgi:hypothetical protein